MSVCRDQTRYFQLSVYWEEEKAEQQALRKAYVESVRNALRGQLNNIDIEQLEIGAKNTVFFRFLEQVNNVIKKSNFK